MQRPCIASSVLAAAGLALTGCSDPSGCLPNIVPAIEVQVRDAGSDAYIADIARGIVHTGSFVDSLRVVGVLGTDPPVTTTLGAADERPGIYTIHIEAEGYLAWDTANVAVISDGCHVITSRSTARLSPAP